MRALLMLMLLAETSSFLMTPCTFEPHRTVRSSCGRPARSRAWCMNTPASPAEEDDDEEKIINLPRVSDAPADAPPRKMGEQTATLRREFDGYIEESAGLPGYLRGATNLMQLSNSASGNEKGNQPAASISEEEALRMVPTNEDVAIYQAKISLVQAVAAGMQRLRCDVLIPGLNPMIDARFPYQESVLLQQAIQLAQLFPSQKVMMLFDSAGTAASAQAFYKRMVNETVPKNLIFSVASRGRVIRDKLHSEDFTPDVKSDKPCDIYVVVRPENLRGDSVVLSIEQAVNKVPDACWILLNPLLEDTVDGYTFGIQERDRRKQFVDQFETAYHYRGLFSIRRPTLVPKEHGALLKRFDEPWTAFRLSEGGYKKVKEWDEKPTRSKLNSIAW